MSVYDILLNECANKVTVQELINLLGTYPDNAFVTFVCNNAGCNLLCFKQTQYHAGLHELLVTVELEAIQDFRPHLPI